MESHDADAFGRRARHGTLRTGWAAVSRRVAALEVPQLITLLGLVAASVAVGFGLVFAKLTEMVWRGDRVGTLDGRLHTWVLDHRTHTWTALFRNATRLADWSTVAAVVIVVTVALVVRRRYRPALFMVVAVQGGFIITNTVKGIVGRPRPATADRLVQVSGAAFPSGHATQSMVCYGALAMVVIWLARSPGVTVVASMCAGLVAAVVGGSRVYLGVHWPSDVVAGWCMGFAWLAALVTTFAAVEVLLRRRGRRLPPLASG